MKMISEHLKNKDLGKSKQKRGMIDEKICPFQSTADKQAPCTAQCKLYRFAPKNAGYECPFQELIPISFGLRFLNPKKPSQTQN